MLKWQITKCKLFTLEVYRILLPGYLKLPSTPDLTFALCAREKLP